MRENDYQRRLIKQLRKMFVSCFILKNDPAYLQGIPDILILFNDKWAMLEVKASIDEPIQPNQDYYIDLFSGMSFGAFISPENEEEVLHALQQTFRAQR